MTVRNLDKMTAERKSKIFAAAKALVIGKNPSSPRPANFKASRRDNSVFLAFD